MNIKQERYLNGEGAKVVARRLESRRRYNKTAKGRAAKKRYRDSDHGRLCANAGMRSYRQSIRLECLRHYGGEFPKCACCGEDHIEFLGIDHIEGGGSAHRRELRKIGSEFFIWLRRNKFPPGFRVLCHNCNSSFGYYGYCPHTSSGTIIPFPSQTTQPAICRTRTRGR